MPRHAPKPKSINDWGGIKPYLDGTADVHHGLKFKDFKLRIDPNRKHKVPKPVAAEDFGVSTQTFYDWIKRYETQGPTVPNSSAGPPAAADRSETS